MRLLKLWKWLPTNSKPECQTPAKIVNSWEFLMTGFQILSDTWCSRNPSDGTDTVDGKRVTSAISCPTSGAGAIKVTVELRVGGWFGMNSAPLIGWSAVKAAEMSCYTIVCVPQKTARKFWCGLAINKQRMLRQCAQNHLPRLSHTLQIQQLPREFRIASNLPATLAQHSSEFRGCGIRMKVNAFIALGIGRRVRPTCYQNL